MRVLILDQEKITHFNLPNKVSGVYAFDYLPMGSKIKRTVSIEAKDDQWILKSNESISIVDNGMIQQSVILTPYYYQPLYINGRHDNIGIYCIPNQDEKFGRYVINSNSIIVGSSNDCSITYSNDLILPQHFGITKTENGWFIQASNDVTHCTYLNGKRVMTSPLKTGDVIFAYGLKIIWMGTFFQLSYPYEVFINSTQISGYMEEFLEDNTKYDAVSDEEASIELYNEHDYFFHTPRLKQSVQLEQINIDGPPNSQMTEEMPFLLTMGSTLTMLSTSVVTGYTAISGLATGEKDLGDVMPSIIMCAALLIGTILMPRIATIYQKRKRKQKEKLRQEKYTKYVKDKENEINLKLANQAQILRDNNISIAECYQLVFGKNRTFIWNREIRDEDFLTVRLGMGTCPAKLEIKAPQEHFTLEDDNLEQLVLDVVKKSHDLENVPITFSFLEKNVSAFICNSSYNLEFLNGVLLQLLTYHSSLDVKLVFLLPRETNDFNYARYAPHCITEDKSTRFFATNMEDIKNISNYIQADFDKRKQDFYGRTNNTSDGIPKQIDHDHAYKNFSPYYVIITNDYTAIKDIPLIQNVLKAKDNLGFSLTIIDDSLQSLPNECSAFIEVLDKECCVVEKELNNQSRFYADVVKGMDMRAVVNRLANIPIAYADASAALPNSLTFLEMYQVARIEQLNILNKWKENDPTVSLQAPIGVHTSGEIFELDLHEKAQGPHGLIAGSTGSGKSEFIITYVLSMAVNYHPDEVQFVLIDYKGGGLAGAFENRETGVRIPHVVGTITNLDTSDMNRSLVSINSELKRRQRMFNEAKNETGESTIDIYKYQHYYREGVLKEPISHLFIVSDEFAELKSQQPEFMNELISTARIGRSLGVHLILATQKPSGVVNDQIWSNTRFRVCLKVQDRSDSMEVLKKPDAASLKETGRFFLQVGYDEYFDIGQSGWSGAKYIPADAIIKKTDSSIKFINNTGNVVRTVDDVVKKVVTKEHGDQLTNIVKYLDNIAKSENYTPHKLWLDKIPAEIFLSDLEKKYDYQAKEYYINPVIGEYDNPEEQMQGILTLDITNANTLIYGMADSGKEDLISSLIYSSITHHSVEEVNFYILDFGAETLKAYSKDPHVGEVCTADDGDKILNMFVMIDKELDRRKELFVDYGGSYTNYIENSGEHLPLISIIINNYEGFNETLPKVSDLIVSLYRDSLKYGISFVVVAGSANSFRVRLAEYFSNKLCLQMANDGDYRSILMCARNLVPAKIYGRGITGIGDLKYEFQTAYICKRSDITNQIKETVTKISSEATSHAPKVPVLPKVVTLNHVIDSIQGLSHVPIGIEMNSKLPYTYDLTHDKAHAFIYDTFQTTETFFYAFFKILKSIPSTKLRVLDVKNMFDVAQMPVDYYNDKIASVIKAFIDEMKNQEYEQIKRIYFIHGAAKLKSCFDTNTMPIYQEFFKLLSEVDNTIVILSDEYEDYKTLQLETWYRDLVSSSYGVWFGTGIGNQLVFKLPGLSMDIRNANYPDMAFAIEDGNAIPIKKVTNSKEEDESEK